MTAWLTTALVLAASPGLQLSPADAVTEPSSPRRTLALVVRADGLGDAAIARVRERLSETFMVVSEPANRRVLESFSEPEPAEKKVRDALERAKERLRVFDLPAVREALAEARSAATRLPPTPDGRRLAAEVAVREAATALIGKDRAEAQRAMRFALSADASLKLDATQEPPPLMALLAETRTTMAREPSARVQLRGPVGLQACQLTCAPLPLSIDLPPGPAVIWAIGEGYLPQALWFEARPGGEVSIDPTPVAPAEALRPLVRDIRAASGEAQRSAALALANALRVDAIAVLDPSAPDSPAIYERVTAPVAVIPPVTQPPPEPQPWYRRPWVWGTAVGVGAAVVIAVVIVGLSAPSQVQVQCCR